MNNNWIYTFPEGKVWRDPTAYTFYTWSVETSFLKKTFSSFKTKRDAYLFLKKMDALEHEFVGKTEDLIRDFDNQKVYSDW